MRRRQKARGFGHTAGGTEYCPGYVDRHGQWNNGFYCPKWGGPERRYCCGTDTDRFCCPEEKPRTPQTSGPSGRISLTIGLTVGCLVLVTMATIIVCHVCRCCWAYKRRKRLQQERTGCPLQHRHLPANYAVNYTTCPHRTFLSDVLAPTQVYPMEDPPPYPGDCAFNMDEKVPLNQQDNCHNDEHTDDDEAAAMVTNSGVGHLHDNNSETDCQSPRACSPTTEQQELRMSLSNHETESESEVLQNQSNSELASHDSDEVNMLSAASSLPCVTWTETDLYGSHESVNSQLSSHMECSHAHSMDGLEDYRCDSCNGDTSRDIV